MSNIKNFVQYARTAQDNFKTRLSKAEADAKLVTVDLTDETEGISIAINGELRVAYLEIDEEIYDDHNEDSLANAFLNTYRNALEHVHQAQHQTIKDQLKDVRLWKHTFKL